MCNCHEVEAYEILAEKDGYRAVLRVDDDRVAPSDDGAVPSFTTYGGTHGGDISAEMNEEHLPMTPKRLLELFEEFDRDAEKWARFMRIFGGAAYAKAETWQGYSQSDWGWEFRVATPKWIESMGWETTDEGVAALSKEGEPNEDPTELVSYVIGDVYGIIVQKDVADYEDDEDAEPEWEDTDTSCWGFYGPSWSVYFREEAERMIEEEQYVPPTQTSTDS